MRTIFSKRVVVCMAASMATMLAGGAVAFAHIHPDPLAMQVNTSGTVGFTIEHGCDGSPTTSVKIQIPADLNDVVPIDKAGWTATVSGDSVEFSGGPLAADLEDHFDISLTAPAQPGELRFPIIQTCQQGELAWIEVEQEGGTEPEHPAPVLEITEGPPTSVDLAPAAEPADDSGTASEGTLAPTATVVAVSSGDDSSNTGVIVAVVIVVVVVLVGGGFVVARRRGAPSRP
ncbi:MAG TPA: DUF1775 domain-containing protein [Ilumatobacteraceae bacterium]|nr:DUF1775 domain-containing protein [Ilumatobacteraceae bacterium]